VKIIAKVQGLKNLTEKLTKYNLITKKKVKDHVLITGLNIQTTAKKNAPVDKGGLRGSIRTLWKKPNGLGMEVGTTIVYGTYIEFGTPEGTGPHGGPKPYLNPAAEQERPKYIKELKKILKRGK